MASDDPRSKRERYEQLAGALKTERASYDSHWAELSRFLVPRRSRFQSGDRNKGDKRNADIINSTARFSARTLQSGLHAGLTSPARPWFKLGTPDPDLARFAPVKEWLHQVTQRMQVVFADTNLYNTLSILYGDLGVFGTSAMCVLEDSEDLFRCYAYPIGSYCLGLSERNIATTFTREYQLTVRQIVRTFGVRPGSTEIDWSHLSRTVQDLWTQGQYETPVDVCWVVCPNDDADPNKLGPEYLPWTSCHFERGESRDGRLLRESGFHSFPILAPRWDVTGEDTYGTDCPGMTALGDVKQLQLQEREKAKAIRKMIDPALVGAPELRTQKTSLLPGDITYVREPQHGLRAIHEITLNIDHLVRDMGEVQYRIQRAFFEDLFLMLARSDDRRGSQPVTAREIDERHEEKLISLGPVLERTNDELLSPLIDRAYLLMDRAGLVPEPPPELEGVKLKVEYTSILAEAQKLVGVTALDRLIGSLAPLVPVFPEIRFKLDVFQLVDDYAEMLGVDPRLIRPTEEATALQAEQAQQQQNQMDAERAKTLAEAARAGSQAPLGQDSALDRVVSAAGQTVQ